MSIQHRRLQAQVDDRNARIAELTAALAQRDAELAEARKHAEQYRQNWLALQEVTGEDCKQRAMEVIREARKDGERLATLYETVQIISVPYILMRLDMPEEAGWDGATCLWTREIFNITIDNATAARGAK